MTAPPLCCLHLVFSCKWKMCTTCYKQSQPAASNPCPDTHLLVFRVCRRTNSYPFGNNSNVCLLHCLLRHAASSYVRYMCYHMTMQIKCISRNVGNTEKVKSGLGFSGRRRFFCFNHKMSWMNENLRRHRENKMKPIQVGDLIKKKYTGDIKKIGTHCKIHIQNEKCCNKHHYATATVGFGCIKSQKQRRNERSCYALAARYEERVGASFHPLKN